MQTSRKLHLLLVPGIAAGVTMILSGCAGVTAPSALSSTQALHMNGSVHGGQQPVSGGQIYLYSVGTSNFGASTSLLSGSGVTQDASGNGYVSTDVNGNFSITGDYTCPTGNTAISTYLLATGGYSGGGTGTSNPAITLMAALGPCSSLTSSTFVNIDEVSTVAAVTALQQFMADATHIGAFTPSTQPSYSAVQSIPNAMLVVNNLVDLKSGIALAIPATGTGVSPQAKLNTIANILSSCVNSASPSSQGCAALFGATTPAGGTAPQDVVSAMLQIARNPGANVATLFNTSFSKVAFQPALSVAPNDYSLAIAYTAAGLTSPGALTVDNAGDIFTANCPSCNGAVGADSIVGLTPSGSVMLAAASTTSVHKPTSIAIDRYNALWVTEAANATFGNQVTRLAYDTGNVQSGFPIALTGAPGGMALIENSPSAAWITDSTNGQMNLINNDGSSVATVTTTGLANPTAIAADGLENLYVIGAGSTNVLKYGPIYDHTQQNGTLSPGVILNQTTLSGAAAGLSSPTSLAIDGGDHLWTVDTGSTQAVSELFGYNGAASSGASGYTGINTASSISIDGHGTAWIANCRINCAGSGSSAADNIVHLSAAGTSMTPSDGLQDSSLSEPTATAIDISGNLWVSDTAAGTLTELVGVAAPVVTELETASSRNALGAVNYLQNPSFENGATGSVIPDWTFSATGVASVDSSAPLSGQQKLTFYSGVPYTFTGTQTVSVPNGNYLVSCYIASAPGSTTRTTSLQVGGYGGSTMSNSPTDLTFTFQPYSLLVPVTTGTLTVGLYNNETYPQGGYVGWDSCSVTAE